MRTAVIGVGVMGSRYAMMPAEGKVKGMELYALTRVKDEIRKKLPENLPVYQNADCRRMRQQLLHCCMKQDYMPARRGFSVSDVRSNR